MHRLILLLAICAGCATQAPAPAVSSRTAGDQMDSLSGSLRVVGSAPMNVRLALERSSGSTTVTGSLEGELRRLAGAEVTLLGRADGTSFIATDYRIRSIDGQPVVVGIVEAATGGNFELRTSSGELIYLVGTPQQFQVGQKVWVQGPRAVVVQSFGTLRP